MVPLKISPSVQFLSTIPKNRKKIVKKFTLRIFFHFNPCICRDMKYNEHNNHCLLIMIACFKFMGDFFCVLLSWSISRLEYLAWVTSNVQYSTVGRKGHFFVLGWGHIGAARFTIALYTANNSLAVSFCL